MGCIVAVFVGLSFLLALVAYVRFGQVRKRQDEISHRLFILTQRINALEKKFPSESTEPSAATAEPPAATSMDDFLSPKCAPAASLPVALPVDASELASTEETPPQPPPLPLPPVETQAAEETSLPEDETVSGASEMAPPAPVSGAADPWTRIEKHIGERWLIWVGVLVLFFSVVFFVKYAIDSGWLSERVRVLSGVAFGVLLMGLGVRFVMRKMRALGQGLIGGGLAMVHGSLYLGFAFYEVVPQPVAFGLMVLGTAAGLTLAVVFNALPISVLALLGGFLAPVLASTGTDARDILFTYILILDIGALGVAWFRRWRALDALAFIGTTMLFMGWFHKFYATTALAPTMTWLSVFYLVFLILPFTRNLRRRLPAVGESFALVLGNSVFYSSTAWHLLGGEHREALAVVVLAMSACSLIMAVAFRKRIPDDRCSHLAFLVLSMVFLTWAIPLRLGLNGTTLAWAAEAAALLFLGYKFSSRLTRAGALVVLGLTLGRLFFWNWPGHHEDFALFANVEFGLAAWVVVSCGAFAVVHHLWRKQATPGDRTIKLAVAHVAGVLAVLFVHVEVGQWLTMTMDGPTPGRYYVLCAGCVLWSLGGLGFIAGGIYFRNVVTRLHLALFLVLAALVQAILLYEIEVAQASLFLNARFFTSLAVVAAIFVCGALPHLCGRRCSDAERLHCAHLHLAAAYALLTLLSVEIFIYSHAPWAWFAVTCAWVLAAQLILLTGLGRTALWRGLALPALAVSLVLAFQCYIMRLAQPDWLVLNSRFLAGLAMALAIFAHSFLLQRRSGASAEEKMVAAFLRWTGLLALLILLSVENYTHFIHKIADPVKARWVAQASLSVLWSVYAAVVLALGFWWRKRSLRFASLALFGATVTKLAVLDLWRLKEFARIISFAALGLLLIVAAYVYHRLEKHLEAETAEQNDAS